jgi:hypothetical protein
VKGAFYPVALILVALILGDEHPHQGDVLELTQVAEVVINGEAPLTRPSQGFSSVNLPNPPLQRRYRTHIRDGAPVIEPFRLVEQVESAV